MRLGGIPTNALLLLALAAAAVGQVPDSLKLPELDAEIARNQAELDRTRQQLNQVRVQVEQLGAKEQASLGKLNTIEEQVTLTQRYLRQLRAQAEARTREVAAAAVRIRQTTELARAREADLARRLVSVYKYGRTFPLEALLSTRSLPEMYRKLVYLRWIARADRKLAGELVALSLEQEEQRRRLLVARADLGRLADEQARQERSLAAARAAEQAMLSTVRSQRTDRESLAVQLAGAAGRLEALVGELLRRKSRMAPGESEFARGRGTLPWPLRGRLASSFGAQTHPRYGTRTTNLGVDIETQAGTTAAAVAAGSVVYADQFLGYGKLVIVDHGAGFYTLYGHLDDIGVSVGTAVEAGSAVGTAGDLLHFEVRRDGKPVNPLDWLKP